MNSSSSPLFLFRFRSLAAESIKFVKSSIENNEIYLAPPSALNDPYDCQIALDTSGTDQEWRKHILCSLKNKKIGKSKIGIVERIRIARRWMADENHKKIDGKKFSKITNSFGIACFSSFMNNQLMWSHYADNHRGICLIYKPSIDSSGLLSSSHEIQYSEYYPKVRLVELASMGDVAVSKLLLTKSKVWVYENEFRILLPYAAEKTLRYDPAALIGVILGARISIDQAREVCNWVRNHPSKPIIHQAELNNDKFGVSIDYKKSK
jgi:hypothetical protein